MKTISMSLEEYNKEIADAEKKGETKAKDYLYEKFYRLLSHGYEEIPAYTSNYGSAYQPEYWLEWINTRIKDQRYCQSSRDIANGIIRGVTK